MSKKQSLLYKKYYYPSSPGVLSDEPYVDKPVQRPFRHVIEYLEKAGYLLCHESGDITLLPLGVALQNSILQTAQTLMEKQGAVQYRFPTFFTRTDENLNKSLVDKFIEQIFPVGDTWLLKYASDPLVFKHFEGKSVVTPLKVYSPDYFFRAVKTGEIKPLIHPREFLMTDFHFFVEKGDWDSYLKAAIANLEAVLLFAPKDEVHLILDTNETFFLQNSERILKMLDLMSVPATVKITSERTHYYSIQNQYIVDYYCGNRGQLSNLQYDEKNGATFSISSKETGNPVDIIHGTIFGRVEQVIGLIFGKKLEEINKSVKTNMPEEHKDHKQLGRELDLFVFSDIVGSGLPLWTPKGTILRDNLDDFVWSLRKKHGYEKVEIPHITKKSLYEKSGHWDKFSDDLFRINTREKDEFVLKPMNCPHHIELFSRKPWSYRDMPQRYANTTMVYRDEQSGELNGLSRVRCITQDDAHVFCRESQIREEFLKVWDIVQEFYQTFKFKGLKVRLSFHNPKTPEKYLGARETWDTAEDTLRNIAKASGMETVDGIGEAAFYGPKLDFMVNDSLGREWQVATIQLDFNMPERFDLTCVNDKGEKERIFIIHAAIMGSIERFLSIFLEHTQGNFPVWLSPVQVVILPISDKHLPYAQEIFDALQRSDIRVELDDSSKPLGKRIHEVKKFKTPYFIVIGDDEVASRKFTLENRSQEKVTLDIKDTILHFCREDLDVSHHAPNN